MKKFKFRLQVMLDLREKELEQRQMEMAKIVAALNEQQAKLQNIFLAQENNTKQLEALYSSGELNIMQIENHKSYSIKLVTDANNQERIINNTKSILAYKQKEVKEAYQKVEILKKLKEKQEKEYYKNFLALETKEIDDITSARFKIN